MCQRAMRFAGTALIAATDVSGLKTDSVALVFQALAIDRSRVDERTGTVSEAERAEVQIQLRILTGEPMKRVGCLHPNKPASNPAGNPR